MRLATLLTAALLVAGGLVAPGSAVNPCESGAWSGNCSVSNSGSQVDISGSTTQPGTRPTAPDSGGREPGPQTPPPAPPCPLNRCDLDYEVVGLPDVTASDLVSFRPAQPSLAGEPEGLGVVGMPTNVVGAASEQRISGSLFGYDVVARFTPMGYVFDYGDGSVRRSSSGGSTWERLGQAQFTPTSTSHTYAARGEYRVAVTVEYAASVDFGSGTWRPVAGLVSATTGGYGVRVVEVRTALVHRSCTENPSGPGC